MTKADLQTEADLIARRLVASTAPAVLWTLTGCPFDVVKTRIQTALVPFSSPAHCLAWTLRNDGIGALWKGCLPQFLIGWPYTLVMFGVYQSAKPHLAQGDHYFAGCFAAGAASGVAVTILHNPMELWRVRLQTHEHTGLECCGCTHSSTLLRRELTSRPQLLFRGISMTFTENVVGNGVFFSSNERLQQLFSDNRDFGLARWLAEVVVGGLTGVIFQASIYPADLLKARLMTHDTMSVRSAAVQLLREEGIRGLYRGASVLLLRAFVINSAGWPALWWAQRRLGIYQ